MKFIDLLHLNTCHNDVKFGEENHKLLASICKVKRHYREYGTIISIQD